METFIRLGLKEIASIVGTLGLNTNIEHLGPNDININGKTFNYEKDGNNLIVKDDNQTLLIVSINAGKEESKDFMGRKITSLSHEVSINYFLEDGSFINFYNNIPLYEGYEAFENVQRHDLLSNLKTTYCDNNGKELAYFDLGVSRIRLTENNHQYGFFDDGVTYSNKMLTLEGDKLISLAGSKAPSLEEAKSFNKSEEEEKIRKFLRDSKDLHPFTKKVLNEAIDNLSFKEGYSKEIIDCYSKDMKDVRKAIAIRNQLIKGIENFPLSIEAFQEIDTDFRNKTQNIKQRALV